MRGLALAIRRITTDADGQDLIEYGMLVGLITLVAMLAIGAVGTTINTMFWSVIANGLTSSL
jgi:Flp pilus assembly pilin Flp